MKNYRVQIKNSNLEVTNQASFDTNQECLDWVAAQGFKVNAVKTLRQVCLANGVDISELTPIIETVNGVDVVSYMVPPSQSYTITNLSAENAVALRLKESLEADDLCKTLKAEIRALNKKKLADAVWDSSTFSAFVASPVIAQARMALADGSLNYYKAAALQSTAFYTQPEIDAIIAKVDAHIAKWTALGVL